MTCKELIEALQRFPADKRVFIAVEKPLPVGLYNPDAYELETLWADSNGHEFEELHIGLSPHMNTDIDPSEETEQ